MKDFHKLKGLHCISNCFSNGRALKMPQNKEFSCDAL